MRQLHCDEITAAVREMCMTSVCDVAPGMEEKFIEAEEKEKSPLGKYIYSQMLENLHIAQTEGEPVCQDTGFAIVIAEIGQDLHMCGGYFEDAINEGVRQGYTDGYLRKSMLADPLFDRKNTGDNTPAMISTRIVKGDKLRLILMAKGGGSENVGAVKMLKPADGVAGVKDFVLDTIKKASGAPCPPIIVGVGVGGTMEKAAKMSKLALIRKPGEHHADPRYAELEQDLLDIINATGIGPQGLGGTTTALAVHVEDTPTHMACLPVAVSIFCSAAHMIIREL